MDSLLSERGEETKRPTSDNVLRLCFRALFYVESILHELWTFGDVLFSPALNKRKRGK